MVTATAEQITLLFQKIEEELVYLQQLNNSLQQIKAEDYLLQFPNNTDSLYLEAGASFEHTTQVSRKLKYLSIDAPEGVLVTIMNDNQPILFMIDEIGAIQFTNGISIGTLCVKAANSSIVSQKWSLRMVFV
jgi:hypothetical protein